MSRGVRGGVRSPASPFNIGLYIFSFLAPIFFLLPWDLNMVQGMFFVFGTIALLGLSFMSSRQRLYNNWILGFLIIWSLMNVFIHSFSFSLSHSSVSSFINFAMLNEGFIFVLFGCVLFWLIVNYSDGFNIVYSLVFINILNFVFAILQKTGNYFIWTNIVQPNQINICGLMGTKSQLAVFSALSIPLLLSTRHKWLVVFPFISMYLSQSYTGLIAFFIGMAFYLSCIRSKFLSLFLIFGVFVSFFVEWNKFIIRPHLWAYTFKEIIQHPFIGWGFDNSINMNKIFLTIPGRIGEFCYRHNDYLNIARDQGLPFLLVLTYGVWKILREADIDLTWIAIIILMIACFNQYSFYYPRIAVVGIMLLALKEVENLDAI